MRDFRDAKAMAKTLRAALADKALAISNSESLELIAKALGTASWNTLAAAIRSVQGTIERTRSRAGPNHRAARWARRIQPRR